MSNRRIQLAAAAVWVMVSGFCLADAIVVAAQNWDTGAENWQSRYGWTVLTDPQTPGGNPDGWLQITFGETTVPEGDGTEDEWYDVVHVDAQDVFAGNWTTNMWIQFDFWAQDESPAAIEVQWSSSTNENVWGYVLTPPTTEAWTTLTASFEDWRDWRYSGASEDLYLSDLSTIDWIGVYVQRSAPQEQVYGIDNFELMAVPEPGQYVMLGAALVTSALSLRRRRPWARQKREGACASTQS